LSWTVGFAISFAGVSFLLLVYSLAQPSLWLPILFAIAFVGLLMFSPRVSAQSRLGLGLILGSGSCVLWMISGSETFQESHAKLQNSFEILLVALGLIGVVLAAGASLKAPPKSRPVLGPILFLILLGWLISYFSSSHGGAAPMVDWVMRHLHLRRPTAETFVLVLRKTIHVTFYATVALTGFLASKRNGAARQACFIAALLTTLAYASFDEMRQSTQPGRTGSIWDVLLDTAGGSVALIGVALLTVKGTSGRPTTPRKSSTL
jgi:VanZ family protein